MGENSSVSDMFSETVNPKIVVVSSSNTRPKSLIKLVTGSTQVTDDNGTIIQSWQIDNKYYTAMVDFYGLDKDFNRTDDFNKYVEALIVHMDTNKETGLSDLDQWLSLDADCDLGIKLLVANYCDEETTISKSQATEWCLERGFELVELYPKQDAAEDSDDSDTFSDKLGVERIKEALQAHVWPNLIKKNHSNKGQEDTDDEEQIGDLDRDDCEEDFIDIFSRLNLLKESMKTMPQNQRIQCAEQVVTAFWQAIGGDEEEIADI